MEALRTVKEVAEQPEKEAKERHLKAWEGKSSHVVKKNCLKCFTVLARFVFCASSILL